MAHTALRQCKKKKYFPNPPENFNIALKQLSGIKWLCFKSSLHLGCGKAGVIIIGCAACLIQFTTKAH